MFQMKSRWALFSFSILCVWFSSVIMSLYNLYFSLFSAATTCWSVGCSFYSHKWTWQHLWDHTGQWGYLWTFRFVNLIFYALALVMLKVAINIFSTCTFFVLIFHAPPRILDIHSLQSNETMLIVLSTLFLNFHQICFRI